MNAFSRSGLVKASALTAAAALVLTGCTASEETCVFDEDSENLQLCVGTALPITGNLAFLGPPEEAGVYLAEDEINSAGAGIELQVIFGDSGDTDNKAYETEVPRLLNAGVAGIVGAASSGVSLQFIDQVTGSGVIHFSPANTSAAFTTYDDDGLYFRTAPSDVLQGEVLANQISADGHEKIAMIVLNDPYGTGLRDRVQEVFEASGGEVLAAPTYNTGDTNFTSQINEVLAVDPDAIVLITFDEFNTIAPDLAEQYDASNFYLVDGNLSNYSEDFEPGLLEGAKGTLPGVDPRDVADFNERLNDFWVSLGNDDLNNVYAYGAESYDATMLLALASLAAGSTDSREIADKLQEVSGGSGNGEKCTSFAECAEIINGGGVADYDGVSSEITFDEVGDPQDGSVIVYQYGADNNYAPLG
jgi:branched-chain amino acid transport system substrate-binding protein